LLSWLVSVFWPLLPFYRKFAAAKEKAAQKNADETLRFFIFFGLVISIVQLRAFFSC
jgi:hypothetical protein